MYPCLVVNQDGSTYHINHRYPHHIVTLPLDPLSLTQEEREVCIYGYNMDEWVVEWMVEYVWRMCK